MAYVALITGASSGIGEAVARRLASEPDVQLILVARREDRLAALADELGNDHALIYPADLTDVVEAVGAGGFVAIGLSAVAMGLPYLKNFLPLGQVPGAVSSSGTIALISFFVGIEVAAAFILIVGELLDQTLLIRQGGR